MLHDKMKKMLDKKKGHNDLSDVEQHAKKSVLEDLRDQASKAMSSKLDGMKKVSVGSNSKEGLSHGLEMAHDIVQDGMPELPTHSKEGKIHDMHGDSGIHREEPEGSPEEEALESESDEAKEDAGHSVNPHGVVDQDMLHDEHDPYAQMPEHELDSHLEKLMKHKAKHESKKGY